MEKDTSCIHLRELEKRPSLKGSLLQVFSAELNSGQASIVNG
jgi:hypothetical protein